MLSLSKRLLTIAECVPEGSVVADIGCDHGKLSVYLILSGKAKKVYASDIRQGPLKAAIDLVSEYNLQDSVLLRKADGFEGLQEGLIDCAVISGLGGETIIHVLETASFIHSIPTLILEPQSKFKELRNYLLNNDFLIQNEIIVEDNHRYYPVLSVSNGISSDYTLTELYTGKKDLIDKSPFYSEYLKFMLSKIYKAVDYNSELSKVYIEIEKWLSE